MIFNEQVKNGKMPNCSCQKINQNDVIFNDIWGNASNSAQHPVDGSDIKSQLAQFNSSGGGGWGRTVVDQRPTDDQS